MMAGLFTAGALALAVAGAQLMPMLEYTGMSFRAAESEGFHDIYAYSTHPLQLFDAIWPSVFGTLEGGYRSWLNALPPKPIPKAVPPAPPINPPIERPVLHAGRLASGGRCAYPAGPHVSDSPLRQRPLTGSGGRLFLSADDGPRLARVCDRRASADRQSSAGSWIAASRSDWGRCGSVPGIHGVVASATASSRRHRSARRFAWASRCDQAGR